MAPHAVLPDSPPNGVYGSNGQSTAQVPSFDSNEQPNILYIMADQMAAPILRIHDPTSVVQTPNIDKLAAGGVVFDRAYCNSPLCAPSRFCMVTGKLPSKIKGYDNASQLGSDIPTYAHHLRNLGYETTLAGKMHFIGPDQLHGFENRLTPDIYPGDFGWAVNWDRPDERQEWYHNMSSVLQAGPAARTNQLDYDEEVMYKSTQFLYDHVRKGASKRPFFLNVSLTHPHDPYAISEELWDQYEGVEIPLPSVEFAQDEQDSHSKRLLKCIDLWDKPLPTEAVIRARRAYFAACTYVDNQIGRLLKVLKECKLEQNTIIIFSGDHGDMLGERNMWYKMSFFEMSARVPLLVHYPQRFKPRRVEESVSTMDLLPTLVDIAGGSVNPLTPIDGESLYPALIGRPVKDEVFGEYMGEGTISPVVMIRTGPWKYVASLVDAPQLFNLSTDAQELTNLCNSSNPKIAAVEARFAARAQAKWNLRKIHDEVLQSQRERRVCFTALKQGRWEAWDFEPPKEGASKYIRSTIPLDDLELRARFPPVDALGRAIKTDHPHGIAGANGE